MFTLENVLIHFINWCKSIFDLRSGWGLRAAPAQWLYCSLFSVKSAFWNITHSFSFSQFFPWFITMDLTTFCCIVIIKCALQLKVIYKNLFVNDTNNHCQISVTTLEFIDWTTVNHPRWCILWEWHLFGVVCFGLLTKCSALGVASDN